MSQVALFDSAPSLETTVKLGLSAPPEQAGPDGSALVALPVAGADPDGLRPYQREKVDIILEQLRRVRSTLLVMATGTGKTRTFGAVARIWPGRVLVLAHRTELIVQAWRAMSELTGERIGIEKAHERSYGARIVVGSVQTLREARCASAGSPPFSLIIIDEAHHATAKTYRKILAAFPNAKVLGVTATPNRGDGKAMGRVFQEVAGPALDMVWGIDNGWLSPIEVVPIKCDLGLDKVALKKGGEFADGALDDAIEKAAAEISRATIEAAGQKRTVIFAPGVKTAHAAAAAMNLIEPGSAYAIDGATDLEERPRIIRRHKAGEFPRLANCDVLTEGYDDPELLCALLARPCKTRTPLEQRIGRLTRLWPGIDRLATPEERKAAIALSPKPRALLFDLVDNLSRIDLASPVDILGGTYTDDEKRAAKKKLRETGGDVQAALAEAREEIRRAAQRAAQRKVSVTIGEAIDPFRAFGVRNPEPLRVLRADDMATRGQLWKLRDLGIEAPENCSKRQAGKLIGVGMGREKSGLCSYKQIAWLGKFGINGRSMAVSVGKDIADAYRANGRVMPGPDVIASIVGQGRAVGSEG